MARPGGGASLNNSSVSRAEAEVDKLAEALREQSRIRAPDLNSKLLAEGAKVQTEEVKKRLAMVSTPPPLPRRSSTLTSPVKRLSPEKEASLKSMLENRPLTVTRAKSNTGSPVAASPSSAETLTRLRDSARKPPTSLQVSTKSLVTPTKPPTYEPISPAEPIPEKQESRLAHAKPTFPGFAPTPVAASSPAPPVI